MQTTALTTIEDITAAIRAVVNGDHPRDMKRVEVHQRAARLADLYEMRAAQWRELGVRARQLKKIDDVYASACAVAEKHDRDQVKFWRTQAGAR